MVEPRSTLYETVFRLLSYMAVLCGFASLWISGTFGFAGFVLFIGAMVVGYLLEGSKWQMSERVGTVLTILALPAFYVLWRIKFFEFSSTETALPGILARLILTLTAIKLLQKKGDRDWIFLYVMSFFQLLLAAGLSISALYLGVFVTFVLVITATIIIFEIRRTADSVADRSKNNRGPISSSIDKANSLRRLPFVSFVLLTSIIIVATPLFFVLPRVGGAGLGGSLGGVSTFSGFSDTVQLGGVGRIQQNDEVVMRVRVEDREKINGPIRWRGIALDTFDHTSWKKSQPGFREARGRGERDLIQIDSASGRDSLIVQTVYLEPLDSQVLFAMERPVAVQAGFRELYLDAHGSITFPRSGERSTYKVLSDVQRPSDDVLRRDRAENPRSIGNYLQLPVELDPRVSELAEALTESATNPFDEAALIELYLRNDFGYTLEQKAGGVQPLSDFLFNIREGHCEYFATAMAVMLRTRGIATRVVNGFQQGEYNETADAYVVRQREAHSWVEVYFPGEDVWIAFDPTPAAQGSGSDTLGIYGRVNKYIEALEMIWIQYFVAYDSQEQRSMFASIKRSVSDYNDKTSSFIDDFRDMLTSWWSEVRGDSGLAASLSALMIGIGVVVFLAVVFFLGLLLFRRLSKLELWKRIGGVFVTRTNEPVIEFYHRLLMLLSKKGFERQPYQTPLEFAYEVGLRDVAEITTVYNRVRFGGHEATSQELSVIEARLQAIDSDHSEIERS